MSDRMLPPDQIKAKIQSAFQRAPTNVFSQRFGLTQLEHELRNLRIFGRDAGTDFVETYLDAIVNEAVEAARQRRPSISITFQGCGNMAVEAIAQGLRDRTDLRVDISEYILTLAWIDSSPNFI